MAQRKKIYQAVIHTLYLLDINSFIHGSSLVMGLIENKNKYRISPNMGPDLKTIETCKPERFFSLNRSNEIHSEQLSDHTGELP